MAASSIPPTEQPLAYVFLALHLTGCGVFLFMVLTALIFHSSITRHPVWYSFCLSFIVYTLSYSLLVFSRQRDHPPELLKTDICIGQAVLVYAAPFLAPSASAALVAMLLFKILAAVADQSSEMSPILLWLAIIGPWLFWVGVLAGASAFILRDTSMIILSSNGTYCGINRPVLPRVSASAAAFFALVTLFLEVGIAYRVYKHRRHGFGVLRQWIPMVIRIAVFSVVSVGAVLTGVLTAGLRGRTPSLDIMIAMVPFVTSFTFATQRDLWVNYVFWKRPQDRAAGRGHRKTGSAPRSQREGTSLAHPHDLELTTVDSTTLIGKEGGPSPSQRHHVLFMPIS